MLRLTGVALLVAALTLTGILAACGPAPTPVSGATPVAPTAPASEGTPATQPGGVEVALAAIAWPTGSAVAKVNDVAIDTAAWREEVTRQLRLVTAQYQVDWNDQDNIAHLPTILDRVLDDLVDVELMRQVAAKEKIAVSDADVQKEADAITEQVLANGQYADINAFLQANELTPERFQGMVRDQVLTDRLLEAHGGPSEVEQVHARHILVADEAKANEVLAKLRAGEAFDALAKDYSTDTGTKDRGGDLGWFPAGTMVPEFDRVAFALKVGETSEPVQTVYGYHVIQVQEKGVRPLEEPLLSQVQQKVFGEWLDAQRQAAKIERFYNAAPPGTPAATPTAQP